MYARVLQCVCSAQSEHFALRLQPCFPPSVLPAAFASTKALLSTCCVPQARTRRPLVPQRAWTARSEHSATLAARFSLSSALAAFSALKRRPLCPRRGPLDTTVLLMACSTSCCVQRAITAQAPALLPLCPVPQVITRRKQANHRRIPAASAHLVTSDFCITCDLCVSACDVHCSLKLAQVISASRRRLLLHSHRRAPLERITTAWLPPVHKAAAAAPTQKIAKMRARPHPIVSLQYSVPRPSGVTTPNSKR